MLLLQFTLICPLLWKRNVLFSLSKPHKLHDIFKNKIKVLLWFCWSGYMSQIWQMRQNGNQSMRGFLPEKQDKGTQGKALASYLFWLAWLGECPEQNAALLQPWDDKHRLRANMPSPGEQHESWVLHHFGTEPVPAATYLWAHFGGKFIYYLLGPVVEFSFTCKSMNSNLEWIFLV